jgi:tRNA(fMet)-specific endonuclease VapC
VSKYVIVDTDVFSYLWQGRPERDRFEPYLRKAIPVLSFTTVAEAYFGAAKAGWHDKKMRGLEAAFRPFLIDPYNVEMAKLWGRLKAQARAKGHPLGDNIHTNDLWICANAIYRDAPLLTNNGRHFEDVAGLTLALDP